MQSMMTALRAGAEQGIGCTLSAVECRELLDRLANLDRLRKLVEERVEARSQPKPDGWARNWTKRAVALLAETSGKKPCKKCGGSGTLIEGDVTYPGAEIRVPCDCQAGGEGDPDEE